MGHRNKQRRRGAIVLGFFACLGVSPAAFGYVVTDFAVDPAHATLGDPHEVASPDFDFFILTVYGTFNTSKCYQAQIKREGGGTCGSANSSGSDDADVFADHLIFYISPQAAADFKAGIDWRIELAERNAGCTGGSVTDTFPNAPGESYLRIRGCNDTCLLPTSPTITVTPNPVGCGGSVQICAASAGSGNLEYDWDLDGDGVCGVCSGGTNNGKKCGEAGDCPGGVCFGGGGFDDLTTNTGDAGCLPDQPCCVNVTISQNTTVGVKIRDKGTNVPCTTCGTALVTVSNNCSDGLYCNGVETCTPGLGCQPGFPINCDDGIPCTIDACNEAADSCTHTPNNSVCNNNLYCDGTETCHATLGCQVGTPPNCNDGVTCTTDTCNESTDSCNHTPNNGSCTDGLYCNGTETCDAINGCQAGAPPNCNDGVGCTDDACNESTDSCDHVANSGTCNNGQYCDGTETCHLTLGCQAGTPPNCNDGVSCTNDSCNEITDTCENVTDNAPCSDGLYCNGNEACHLTLGCQAGTPPNCSDGIACTTDACVEATDSCSHTASNAACSDGLYCNGSETCDPISGCLGGTPPNCNDGVTCTLDSCNESTDSCDHAPNNATCDNGLYCDGSETCHITNDCQPGTPPNCNDAVACTADACDEDNNVCTHTPNNAACGDGLFCDGSEYCDATGCHDATDPCAPPTKCDEPGDRCVACLTDGQCNDGAFCNGVETCNIVTGTCVPGTPPTCDDSVPCTIDSCNPGTNACVNSPDNGACNDGLYCNGEETCHATLGCQAGTPPNCDDGVACTGDSCNETTNTCDHTANDAACSDGLYCNGAETCDPMNGCQLGTAPNCSDGVSCTTDACDEGTDACTHTEVDAVCNDGLYCNGVESCDATNDCQAGTPVDCSDGVGCTADTCDEANDVCDHVPNDVICVDAFFCNGLEYCHPTLGCQDGPSVNCSDGVNCTGDLCNEATDSCVHTPSNGFCVDALYCNGVEYCDPINDCQPGTPVDCDDGVACTVDGCYEPTDTCKHQPDDQFCKDKAYCNGVEICNPLVGCEDGPDPCPPPSKCDEENNRCVSCLTDAQCNDGLFCNGLETCDEIAGYCVPGTPPVCNDGIPCTIDTCSLLTDACEYTPDDSSCNNGFYCDGLELCSPTLGCQPGVAPNCNDLVVCTIDACNETTDSCDHTANDGACSDGLYCNGAEACDELLGCQAGSPPDCIDGVGCTTDACNETTDSCDHTPVNAACVDAFYCNGVEYCDPLNGCQAGTPPDCDDAIVCTIDACNETIDSCTHSPDNSLCNDLLYCNGVEFCDPLLGCVDGTPPNCVDVVPCTIDSCDEVTDSCLHIPDDNFCQDGLFCDGTEVCHPTLGCQDTTDPCAPPTKCVEDTDRCVVCSTDVQCNDGLYCNGVETCNVALGICIPGTPPDCDDGVSCTFDDCNEATDSCTHTPDSGQCSDGQYCNGVEVCDLNLGCQAGPPPACADAIPCTVDACDEATDTCVHSPNDGVCNDGAYCNGLEVCNPLTGCTPGTPPNCSDGIACTTDACNEVKDVCQHSPKDGQCNNGLFCDGAEVCDPVNGCVSGPAPNCNDGVNCTIDSCNEVTDACVHGPTDSLCTDGLFCNGVETCDPINDCQAGPPPDCDDGVGCTEDACDENTDLCTHLADDVSCDDTFFCTGAEHCDAQLGCVSGPTPNCDDAVACTVDACDALDDACANTPNSVVCDDADRCTTDVCTAQGCSSANTECGACCLIAVPCMDNATLAECSDMPGQGGTFLGVGTVCTGLDDDGDGVDNACDLVYTIPTVSEWGLVVLTLMLLIGAKLAFGRRSEVAIA